MSPTEHLEIERKYRLRAAPSAVTLAAHGAVALRIEQTYLLDDIDRPAGGGNRRLRRTELPDGRVEHRLTEKRRVGPFSFHERETIVDAAEYARLLAEADPVRRTIRKVRHAVPFGDRTLEIDVFEEPADLVVLEIELGSVDEVVEPPAWLGERREVTGDPAYFNARLSRRDAAVPPW